MFSCCDELSPRSGRSGRRKVDRSTHWLESIQTFHLSLAFFFALPTLNQLRKCGREEKRRTDRTRASDQCPQKQGVRPRVSTRTPKKPNSAPRKIAKVRLSNRHDIFAHIPGEGHNSQEHSMVLIRGGRVKDSPGVKSHCIRGVKDLLGIPDRRRGRSKYGAEKPKSIWMEDASETCYPKQAKASKAGAGIENIFISWPYL